jgi:hypothetical protein
MPRRRAPLHDLTEKESGYRELLAEQGRSGLTLRAFARGKGIPESTLAWWKHTIAERDRARSKTNGAGVSLMPIKVVGPRHSGPLFVVELRSGRRVEVAPGFDPEDLRRLVEVLDGSC